MKYNITKKAIRLIIGLLLIGNAAFGQKMRSHTEELRMASNCVYTDYNITATQGADAQGCYYDIAFNLLWTAGTMSGCNQNDLPHGVCVEFTGTTITSTGAPITAWISGAIRNPASVLGSNFVYWTKQPLGTCTTLVNEIPNNVPQNVRIRVGPATGPVNVYVKILSGNSWTSASPPTWVPPANQSDWTAISLPYRNYWLCGMDYTFNPPSITYNIGPNTSVCSGTFMVLNLSPAPPAGSTVTWYRSNTPCPSVNPWDVAGWGAPAQIGGNSYNTNAMTNNTCFVAVVTTGCWSYISNVRTVTVCPDAPSASISATPVNPYPVLQYINNQWRACLQWQGTLTLAPTAFPCPTTITWWLKYTGTTVWTQITLPPNQTYYNTNLLYLLSSLGCYTGYDFQVKLVNACGTTILPFTIFIDNIADKGIIKTQTSAFYDVGSGTNTAPILCYGMGTRLVHTTTCGKIKWWEYRDEITPCSNNFPSTWIIAPGSNGTATWFTNNLIKTRQYRALVENGGCNDDPPLPDQGIYSNPFTVTVKPELTVNIATTSNLLCMNPVLTASTSYGPPCNYPIASYQWYFNGTLIPGATGLTYHPTGPGNYSVEVSDGQCKSKATSNVITICDAKLVVKSPCCVCLNETVTVSAVVTYSPNNCGPIPTYLWSNGATTPSIQVTQQGNYSVTVTWGTCILTGTAYVGPCN